MKIKTIVITTAAIGAGLVITNYLTDGAVFEAASDIMNAVKEKAPHKVKETTEAVADTVSNVVDTVVDTTTDTVAAVTEPVTQVVAQG